MENRIEGGRFEQEMSRKLAESGFWAHVMQQNKAGQPADIIAVKGKYHTLIDCKVMSSDVFPFRRVEENQDLAMKRFSDRGRYSCWFALKYPDGTVRMLNATDVSILQAKGYQSLTKSLQQKWTLGLKEWLASAERFAGGSGGAE